MSGSLVAPLDQAAWGTVLRRWPHAERRAQKLGMSRPPFEVWRSRSFLVQLFREGEWVRVSVNRTHMPDGERWADGISWDDLQRVKREIGRAEVWACELFPADDLVVNDANMRHLWLLADPPPFAWVTRDTSVGAARGDGHHLDAERA